ncbi:MAG: choice-of-anchor Q domain-containing protein [Bacteroidota bacterium]|nr:choice-of-anchor Q domain-containing protein [Bacteroidota bacterium]
MSDKLIMQFKNISIIWVCTMWISITHTQAATKLVTSSNDSGTGTLRDAIQNASNGDLIKIDSSLSKKTLILSSTLEIPVGKNITIDGINASAFTISGNNSVRVFLLKSTSVTPTSLTIRNLRIMNGLTSEYGAGIRSEHQGKLFIENCYFEGNNAQQGGSAVFSHFEGTCSISNCVFTNNKSTDKNDERGSTVMLWGPNKHSVYGSTFTKNSGINGAAINGLNSTLDIQNCIFTENTTTMAKYDKGNSNPSLRGFGGAIYVDRASEGGSSTKAGSITIKNCHFESNVAQSDGGACHIYTDETDEVIVENCTFHKNIVNQLLGDTNPSGGGGGAIEQMNNAKNKGFTVRNCTFSENQAAINGGAMRIDWAPTTIENCTFYNNKALYTSTVDGYSANGGAIGLYSMSNSEVFIKNCTFANNHAGWAGGAIATSDPSNTKIKNSIFYKNTSANGGNSWGIQQHTTNLLNDQGNNLQFPAKATTNWNDYNVSSVIGISDPLLDVLTTNGGNTKTMALKLGSPAIDKGVDCPTLDQRGAARIGKCDIGAFEFGSTISGSNILGATFSKIYDFDELDYPEVFPNPTNGTNLNLKFPKEWLGKSISISIFSLYGTEQFKQIIMVDTNEYSWNPMLTTQGIYILKITSEKLQFTKRVIVK